ncbi:MAG: hypothetical protein LBE38_11435, partial [Deltaproteobacteria bacterium]|nr:hypothetical protein [Deltaproteobacteria bacterium]
PLKPALAYFSSYFNMLAFYPELFPLALLMPALCPYLALFLIFPLNHSLFTGIYLKVFKLIPYLNPFRPKLIIF